jgi:hypothetical protein
MTTIVRMLPFGQRFSVRLACGHAFSISKADAAGQHLFIGKRYACGECEPEKPLPRKQFNTLLRKVRTGKLKLSDIEVPPPDHKK